MAKRANFGFEKRQREVRKQKKKEEKAARKLEASQTPDEPGTANTDERPAGSSRPERD